MSLLNLFFLAESTNYLHQPLNVIFPCKFLDTEEHTEANEFSLLKWMYEFQLFTRDFLLLAN